MTNRMGVTIEATALHAMPSWAAPTWRPPEGVGQARRERLQSHMRHIVLPQGVLSVHPRTEAGLVRRREVTLIVSLHPDGAFEVRVDGQAPHVHRAALIAPMVEHRLELSAPGVALVLIPPTHEAYRRLRYLQYQGVQCLPRESFEGCGLSAAAAVNACRDASQAATLIEQLAKVATAGTAKPEPMDPRVEATMQLMVEHPADDYHAIARAVGISKVALSDLYSQQIGLSLRSFQVWRKGYAALQCLSDGGSLAQGRVAGGLGSVSQLCRLYHETFGMPPTVAPDDTAARTEKPRAAGGLGVLVADPA